jgi:hypothetical protein
MKRLQLTALLIIVSHLSLLSQNISKQVFQIDSIPAGGILVDKGWRFHTGEVADKSFNRFLQQNRHGKILVWA